MEGFFARSREKLESVVGWLCGGVAAEMEHAGLEDRLAADGRELARLMLQDYLDLRAHREQRLEQVTGADGVPRRSAERNHQRPLATVVGEVTVRRRAYRARGRASLHPADAALNLPAGIHSHGLQRLAAQDAARGSFDQATGAIRRSTGTRIGKRQAEELAQRAAAGIGSFYATTRPPAGAAAGDVLVISADGSGIVMRPAALRPKTRKAAEENRAKLATRLTRGEVRHRKRMAEVGAVCDIPPSPAPRPASSPCPATARGGKPPAPPPTANG